MKCLFIVKKNKKELQNHVESYEDVNTGEQTTFRTWNQENFKILQKLTNAK